jgi:hypothetical protein
MKKYLVLLGAAIMVMALASPSLAQFSSWGHMEVGSYWLMNQKYFDSDNGADNMRGMFQRFRFYLQYGDPKTVRAVIGFEADSKTWGTPSYNQGGYSGTRPGGVSGNTWAYSSTPIGGPSLANGNNMGASNTDQLSLEIKHAYIDFVVPTTPLTVTAGLQFFGVGGARSQFLQSTDLPAVKLTANFAPHVIEAWWARANTDDATKDNNSDEYALRYRLNQKGLSVEAFFVYWLDRRTNAEAWTLTGTPGAAGVTNYTITQTLAARDYEIQPWWLGGSASFGFGNFTIEPTAIYLGGKARKYFRNNPSSGDVDYSAYLLDLLVKYQIGPGLSAAIQGFYASGDDTNKNDKVTKYSYTPGSESGWGFGNDRSVFFFGNGDFQYYGFKNLNPGGLWFGRANVTYSPLTWLQLGANYLYIGDTSKGDTATQAATGASWNAATGARTDANKDYVGSEANLIATLKIYQNITYMIGFGYFFPGDIYEGNTAPGRGTNSPADNAWNLMTNLKYVF